MMIVSCFRFLLSVFLSFQAASAEEKWLRLRTENFEVYTPQGEKKARETAQYFEHLREFFLTYWGTRADPGTPVRIILFGNEKQYAPFRPHEQAAGYFTHGIDRDWIVISGYLPGWERIVCHEYTHLMVRQAGISVPLWLNEGLAEIYSTFKPLGAKIQIGDLIPGHFQAVQTGWIPLPSLVQVKHDSPEYSGKLAAQFYAQSWGLTHMLMLRLESDLQNYMKRNDRFYASLIPFTPTKTKSESTAERLSPSQVEATLTLLLLNQPLKKDQIAARIAKLDRDTWEGHEALGYWQWRNGDLAAARQHLSTAIRLGATSAKLHYDAARAAMYAADRNHDSLAYLQKAISLYPEWVDAKLQLIEQYLYVGENEKALDVGREFKKISPAQASRLFRALAYAELLVNGPAPASPTMRRARESARSDFDRSECDRLEKFVQLYQHGTRTTLAEQMRSIRESADRAESASYEDGVVTADPDRRPRIQRTELAMAEDSPSREILMRPADSTPLDGLLVHMECSGSFPILRFDSDSHKGLEIEMRDPQKVNLQLLLPGEQLKPLELQCGPQSRKVKITYAKPSGDQQRGQLRTIQYVD